MHASMRTGLQIALVVGGGIFFSAQASADDTTTGLDSLAGGTQVVTAVVAPVTVTGNAISVVGDSRSSHRPAATGSGHGSATKAGSATTSGKHSTAGGTQVVAPVTAPVTVTGNAISVVGDSRSSHRPAATGSGHGSATKAGSATTSGKHSTAGGTQVVAPVTAPVTVGGNAISVVGDSRSDGATTGGTTGVPASGTGGSTTSGEDSVLGGTQVVAPVTAPVTVGGNAISVVGDSRSDGATTGGTTGVPASGTGGSTTSGEDSVLGGTQVVAPVTAPVTVGGNAVSVVGDTTTDPVTPTGPVTPTDPTDPATSTNPTAPTTSGSGPAGSVVSAGTMGHTVTAMTAAAPALSRLAQTGAATGLLVGSALLLLLVGGLLTMAGRRRGDLLTA